MGWIRTYDQNINYKQKQRWSKAGTLKKLTLEALSLV